MVDIDGLIQKSDYEGLIRLLLDIKRQKTDLVVREQIVNDAIVALKPPRNMVFEGVGRVELHRSADRKNWDSEGLLMVLRRKVLDPEGTGEIPDANVVENVDRMLNVLRDTLSIATKSAPWKVRGLQGLGVEVDEWCEKSLGTMKVQFLGA